MIQVRTEAEPERARNDVPRSRTTPSRAGRCLSGEAPHGRRTQADKQTNEHYPGRAEPAASAPRASSGRDGSTPRGHQDGDNQPPNEIGAKPPQAGEQRVHLFQVPHIGFKRRISVNPEGS